MANVHQTVIVSDTHIGHDLGLKSDTARHKDKLSGFASKNQEIIWEGWKEFTKKYKNPDLLLLNGDLVDLLTISRKENEMWTSSALEMKTEAVKLMKMFGTPKKIIVIKGTSAHVDAQHITLEKDIAEELHAHKYQNRILNNFALINMAPEGSTHAQVYHVTHHMPSTTGWYRGTAPAKVMASLMLNESHFIDRRIWGKIVGIIRGHVHHAWYEESTSRRMIVNPCWQGATNFMIEKMPESPPDIGSTVLYHHKDGTFNKERFLVEVEKLRPGVLQG